MRYESLLPYSQLVPILSRINPVYPLPFCFFNIHFNNILISIYRSSKLIIFFRFPHQNAVWIYLLPTRSAFPAHLILPDLITRMLFYKGYKL